MEEENFINEIVELYKKNKYQEILELDIKDQIATKLLWVWPSKSNLEFIEKTVIDHNLKGIISIGCGSGLFEWLLQAYTGLPVLGYEVNTEWWTSKYCNPLFIKLVFPPQPPQKQDLLNNHALLFCYFNNREAFDDYIEAYQGNLVFIIGPGEDVCRHTNPEPFKPNFKSKWHLYDYREVKDTQDFIAAYVRVVNVSK